VAAELFRRGLVDRTRALVGWCVGVALYILLLAAVFPSLRDAADLNQLVEKYPEGLKELFGLSAGIDLTTGAGYLDAELFSFMLPIFALVLAIGSGTRILAGEEEAGRLELLFAYPLRRRDGVLAKGATVAVEIALFVVAVAAAMLLFDPIFDLGLSASRVAGAAASLGMLALLHGWLALAVAGFTPSKALATAVPAALAAAGYLVAGLHDLADWLDPLRYAKIVERIGQALHEPAAAARLQARLRGLDGEYRTGLAHCQRREIVTSHEAFGYLAERYGLEQIAITGLSPEVEPEPAKLQHVVELVRKRGVTTIYFETLVSPRIAETVARETGANTAVLNPIEGLTKNEISQGENYFSLMRTNLRTLREGLGCS